MVASQKVHLTPEQLESLGEELDTIRQRVFADLGEEDAAYIRGVVAKQRKLEVTGRALMYLPPAWRLRSRRWRPPRSSTTWRSATTSCTASTTGWVTRA